MPTSIWIALLRRATRTKWPTHEQPDQIGRDTLDPSDAVLLHGSISRLDPAREVAVADPDAPLSPTQCVAFENRMVTAGYLSNGTTFAEDLRNCQVHDGGPVIEQPAVSPEELGPIHRRLADRAESLGYDESPAGGAVPASLYLLVDGKPVKPIEFVGNRRVFVLPAVRTALCIGALTDIKVLRIDLIGYDEFHVIPADHPDLTQGWGAAERDCDTIWRPVTGLAHISTGPLMRGAKIVLHVED